MDTLPKTFLQCTTDLRDALEENLSRVRAMKENASTSNQARYIAVTATELEKVIAYWVTYVVSQSIEVTNG